MSCSTLPHDCSVSMQLSPMERGAEESPRAPIVAFALFRFEWDDEEEPEYLFYTTTSFRFGQLSKAAVLDVI